MKLEDVLNFKEKTEIQKFIKNKDLQEAVKKILLFQLYYSGRLKRNEKPSPDVNFIYDMAKNRGINPSQLGFEVQMVVEGLKLLEEGFENIMKFEHDVKKIKDDANPAR